MKRSLATVLAGCCAVLLAGAGDVRADTSSVYYLALGDSVATGFQPVSKKGKDTKAGYVDVLFELEKQQIPNLRLENLACDGETSGTLRSGGGFCDYKRGSQLADAVAFLHEHAGRVAIVTIDIGGNDIGECFDDFALSCLQSISPTVQDNIGAILGELKDALEPGAGGVGVRVAGMLYYDPFLGYHLLGPAGETLAEASRQFVNEFDDDLESAYESQAWPTAGVGQAFGLNDFAPTELPGFGIVPTNVFNACAWTWFCTRGDIHPNAAGHAIIAQTFATTLSAVSPQALGTP